MSLVLDSARCGDIKVLRVLDRTLVDERAMGAPSLHDLLVPVDRRGKGARARLALHGMIVERSSI